jgi:hypothetical protein
MRPLRQFVRFKKLFFGIVGFNKPVDANHFKYAADLVLFRDNEHRTVFLFDIAQAMYKKADAATVKERSFFQIEHKVEIVFTYQFGNLGIKDFCIFRGIDVPDNMDHFKLPAIFNFIFHERDSPYTDLVSVGELSTLPRR